MSRLDFFELNDSEIRVLLVVNRLNGRAMQSEIIGFMGQMQNAADFLEATINGLISKGLLYDIEVGPMKMTAEARDLVGDVATARLQNPGVSRDAFECPVCDWKSSLIGRTDLVATSGKNLCPCCGYDFDNRRFDFGQGSVSITELPAPKKDACTVGLYRRWLATLPDDLQLCEVQSDLHGRPSVIKRVVAYRWKKGGGGGIVSNPLGSHLKDDFWDGVDVISVFDMKYDPAPEWTTSDAADPPDGFKPSELLLSGPKFRELSAARFPHLAPAVRQWLGRWEMWDLACSPMADEKRSQIRYGHYLGFFAERKKDAD